LRRQHGDEAIEPYDFRPENHMPAATPDPNPSAKKAIVGANETSSQITTEKAAARITKRMETLIRRLFDFIVHAPCIDSETTGTPRLLPRHPTIGASAATGFSVGEGEANGCECREGSYGPQPISPSNATTATTPTPYASLCPTVCASRGG
jgi:hypothetical protein